MSCPWTPQGHRASAEPPHQGDIDGDGGRGMPGGHLPCHCLGDEKRTSPGGLDRLQGGQKSEEGGAIQADVAGTGEADPLAQQHVNKSHESSHVPARLQEAIRQGRQGGPGRSRNPEKGPRREAGAAEKRIGGQRLQRSQEVQNHHEQSQDW